MRPSRLRSPLRLALLGAFTALLAAPVAADAHEHATSPTITVYKDPNCGCCKSWVEHLRKHGFTVVVKDTTAEGMQGVKRTAHVAGNLASCHTAFVDGYVIEGHVPADDVKRLLREHPKVAGLAVPGMVTGSPGMEGGAPQHYDVLSFDRSGGSRTYARH
ncbi:MAG: metal-binding protein [Gemmatimonadetes bacterium]|nr:metal-binding protein [Gemmatimonadota bacterium]